MMEKTFKLVASTCGAGPCPSVREDDTDYIVVGRLESARILPDGSVGKEEAVVRLPKSLVKISAK